MDNSIDNTIRDVIRSFREKKGKDPPQLSVTRDVYKKMVTEYRPSYGRASPAQWAGRKITTLYGVPIVITRDETRYDKNGCYRTSIVKGA